MGTLQQGPRQNNVPFIQKVRLDRLSKQKDRGQQSWPGRSQWAQQVPDSHSNMGSVLNKMGPLECADSSLSPGADASVLLPGESNPQGTVFGLGEQPLPRLPSPPCEYLADGGNAG